MNNPAPGMTEGLLELAGEDDDQRARFIVYQLEVGESGTPHLQGYVVFKKPMRLSAVRQLIPRAHLDIARGTNEQNIAYCTKDETRRDGPWRAGTEPTKVEWTTFPWWVGDLFPTITV